MLRLTLRREKRGDWEVFYLSGAVTEEASLHLIKLGADAGKKCVFNMKDINLVNSNGVRAWVLFLRDFVVDRTVELEECAPVVVSQINMLPSFRQKTTIRSLYVPYICSSCDHSFDVLLQAKEYPADGQQPKPVKCPKCTNPSALSDDEDFFTFLIPSGR